MKKIFLFLVIFSLFACEKSAKNKANNIDNQNDSLNWQKTSYGLWKSKNGDLGILTISASEAPDEKPVKRYITHLDWGADGNGKIIYLKNVIDTLTFEELGSSFYKDKNNVYSFFSRLGGGMFHTVDADNETFQVLGDCYAKDKNHIYVERNLKMDSVDYQTFKTAKDCGCFAKDKNNYYHWGDKISTKEMEEMEDKESKLMIEKLKKL